MNGLGEVEGLFTLSVSGKEILHHIIERIGVKNSFCVTVAAVNFRSSQKPHDAVVENIIGFNRIKDYAITVIDDDLIAAF